MKASEFIIEAGEPENPSRRGFLKGLAGAAATAAMPGGIAKLAAPAAAPAAAAVSANVVGMLFSSAVRVGFELGLTKSGRAYKSGGDWNDEDGDWNDDEDEWDKNLEQVQGEWGYMPWGADYELGQTSNGVPVLWTSDRGDGSDSDPYALITFMDNGKPQWIMPNTDREGHWEELGPEHVSDPKYMSRWNNWSIKTFNVKKMDDRKKWNRIDIVDIVLNPENDNPEKDVSQNQLDKETKQAKLQALFAKDRSEEIKNLKAQAKTKADRAEEIKKIKAQAQTKSNSNVGSVAAKATTPIDLARLAGIAKKGYDALTKSNVKDVDSAQQSKPQTALPAPTKANVLEPNLKQKQAVPVKKDTK